MSRKTPEEQASERYIHAAFVADPSIEQIRGWEQLLRGYESERIEAYATCIREKVEPLEEELEMIEAIGGLSFKPGRRPYELVAEIAASRGDALSRIDHLEAERDKLRALAQELVNGNYIATKALARCSDAMRIENGNLKLVSSDAYVIISTVNDAYHRVHHLSSAAKEQGFVPTNTTEA